MALVLASVGVYVHIPFCERICPYCDFAVVARKRIETAEQENYVAALLAELEIRAPQFELHHLDTIYFGGGTPSLLKPDLIGRIIQSLRSKFGGKPREITLEVNPSTLEIGRLPHFVAAGVNRLSIGVQSFDDLVLKRLGRAHRFSDVEDIIPKARAAGFRNLSLDLIYGAPGQTYKSLERDLQLLIEHAPEHVSAYSLTVEKGTPFSKADARGQLLLPAEEESLAMLDLVWGRLVEAGYNHYELSNFAKPGFYSLHNRRYWFRKPVLGLGMGACSFDPKSRKAPYGARPENPRDLASYLDSRLACQDVILSADEAAREAVFLALRTSRGLSIQGFIDEFGQGPEEFFGETSRRLVEAGVLNVGSGEVWSLTAIGRRVADSVFLELL